MKKTLILMLSIFLSTMFLSVNAQKPAAKWNTPDKYVKMKAVKLTPDEAKTGKDLYNKNCKSCHGGSGMGDGTKAAGLKTPMLPLNRKEFKSVAAGDKYYRSFVGRDEMPNFEKKITSEKDRWAIIEYIGTFK